MSTTDAKMPSFTASTMQFASSSGGSTDATNTTAGLKAAADIAIFKLSLYEGYSLFIGLAIFSFFIARGALAIRYRIYKDKDVMDATFDAGGKVSAGVIATTIVSHWTWAATLLQSTSVTTKYGISGAFWYAAGATIQLFLFAMLIIQLKIRAPGAKTFLQVIRARFSPSTHITFCVFALMTNVIVTAMLMLGGAAVLSTIIDGFSVELATLLFTATISAYTQLGGLGAAYLVSYFNTGAIMIVMMVFLVRIFYNGESQIGPIGSISSVYETVSISRGPDGNQGSSYLTILSYPGLMFGIINIVGNFGTVFVEQSYWQCGVAAKPTQGVIGFLAGGLTWFAVPFVFATTMGLAYLALGQQRGSPLLNADQVDQGLVAPVVGSVLFGRPGAAMVAVMVVMAVTSTGSAEVMAVTSILVFDIYQIYLKPYRLVFDASTCILCGRERGRLATARDKCVCISMTYCPSCKTDNEARDNWKRALKPDYQCLTHGSYRRYNDYLDHIKNWCMIIVTMSIIPLTLILEVLKLSLGWLYLFMGVLIGSAVIPISLSLFWTKLTGPAMTSGAISGAVLGVISWLIVSAFQPGGILNFFTSTGSEVSMLTGNVISILGGGIITVAVSIVSNAISSVSSTDDVMQSSSSDVWENTRDIDNPLRPWTEMYIREMNLTRFAVLDQRPRLDEMERRFRGAKLLAIIGSLILTFAMLIVWPVVTISAGIMDGAAFQRWITLAAVYGFLATISILILPIVTEVYELRRNLIDRMLIETETTGQLPASNSALANVASPPPRVAPGSKSFHGIQVKASPDGDHSDVIDVGNSSPLTMSVDEFNDKDDEKTKSPGSKSGSAETGSSKPRKKLINGSNTIPPTADDIEVCIDKVTDESAGSESCVQL